MRVAEMSPAQRERKREYESRTRKSLYRSSTNGLGLWERNGKQLTVPADVERREFSAPCFACEAKGPCRHRVGA